MTRNERIASKVTALGFHPFIDNDGVVHISAENGDDAADYYGEFRGGYAWVNPKIDTLCEMYDMYYEWDNPGSISLYRN